MVHKFLSANYPYGAFKTRTNQIEIFVSRKEKNLFAPKFKIRVDLQKDGNPAVYLTADTSSSPYVFKLDAPNVFKRWGIKQSSIDITVDHKIGSSLVVDANVLGGIHLEGKRGDNAKNGRDVSLMITKGGVQMIKVSWSTEKVNNENEFKFVLRDIIEVSPESLLYKNIISKYKILTPFNSRTGEFEFYVDKKTRNVLLNKFHAKGKVMKDGKKVVDLEVNTIVKPYKFELFAPALLGKLKPGMTEAKISVAHKPGQSLEIKTNFEKFTGLKIYKTGSGNELTGIICALAVPTLSAWIVIITRQAKHVHYSVLVFWFGVGGLVVSLIGIFAMDSDPLFQEWDIREWMLSLMVALVGILGSILMTKAVCWVSPSKVMVVRSFEVVAAYILQVTVFDVPTHWSDLAGTMCVIGAVIGMGMEDYLMERINWRFL